MRPVVEQVIRTGIVLGAQRNVPPAGRRAARREVAGLQTLGGSVRHRSGAGKERQVEDREGTRAARRRCVELRVGLRGLRLHTAGRSRGRVARIHGLPRAHAGCDQNGRGQRHRGAGPAAAESKGPGIPPVAGTQAAGRHSGDLAGFRHGALACLTPGIAARQWRSRRGGCGVWASRRPPRDGARLAGAPRPNCSRDDPAGSAVIGFAARRVPAPADRRERLAAPSVMSM